MANGPAVGVPPGGVPQAQEPVVQEGDGQAGLACEDHHHTEGQEEDLQESRHPQDIPGLELHQADQQSGSPPGVLAQCVQKSE